MVLLHIPLLIPAVVRLAFLFPELRKSWVNTTDLLLSIALIAFD